MFNHGIAGFMCNGGNHTIIHMSQMHIILGTSHDLKTNYRVGGSGGGLEDLDEQYIIFPGYKVECYADISFGGTNIATLDNTNGTNVKIFNFSSNNNKTSSLKAYYKNVEMPEINNDSSSTYFEDISGPSST